MDIQQCFPLQEIPQKPDDPRYELLLKSLETIEDYAIFTLDPSGKIQNWNHGARRMKGFFPHEVIGRHFSIFYTDDDKSRLLPQFALQIAADKGRFEEEGFRVRKNGERFWANIVITAIKNEKGEVIAFSNVYRDLSDQKAAQEQLRQSEERFRLLIDNVKDYAIVMLDQYGKITSWNAGATRIKGYQPQEIIGKHFSIFYTEEEISGGRPQIELRLASSVEGRFEGTGWRVRKDGQKMWANVILTSVKDASGYPLGFTMVTRDISEQKKIEDLEDSIKMRDEFISVASHELRTPLTRVLLNLQLMKKSGDGISERGLKALDVCEMSTKELVAIMDNLVDVTRLRLGKLEIRRTKTNITKIVLNVLTRFKDDIRLSGTKVSFQHGGDIVGYWDQTRLEQLFVNLLSNSLKFGQGKPVRIELKVLDDQVHFSVTDEGPGIPFHLQSKIFERFERAVGSTNISGLGLGLYVARQIVSAHRGEISLESEPGKGAKFYVVLPVKQEQKKK